jgi:mRNA-degrading endonuclease RelE of RelBE toxin-antitoxin system
MPRKLRSADSSVKLKEDLPVLRSGGENRPFEYPHLYRIQAGDWRISYAVEHNRLAILVLEVLTPEGAVRKDATADTMQPKMKIKLLDWPEGSPSRDLPPEEVSKKLKIRFLDLADELKAEAAEAPRPTGGIKLSPPSGAHSDKSRITFVDAAVRPARAEDDDQERAGPKGSAEGKVTPLDGPSM